MSWSSTIRHRVGHRGITSGAIRCDDPRCFGPGARVHGYGLFPLQSPYSRYPLVLAKNQEIDVLYDELAQLLGKDDALDPDSETARQIAEVGARLDEHGKVEAALLRAELDARLPIPLAEAVAFNQEVADVIARARDRATENPAAKDS